MIVEIQREDLIRLCKHVADTKATEKDHPFKDALHIVPFINGPHYRLSEDWINQATDQQLFEFYQYHSSTIKLITE